MGIIMTILIGFLCGLVARFIKPGADGMGFLMTTVVGIVGAFLAAWFGQLVGWYVIGEPAGFIASVIGAVVVLYIMQALSGRSHRHV